MFADVHSPLSRALFVAVLLVAMPLTTSSVAPQFPRKGAPSAAPRFWGPPLVQGQNSRSPNAGAGASAVAIQEIYGKLPLS